MTFVQKILVPHPHAVHFRDEALNQNPTAGESTPHGFSQVPAALASRATNIPGWSPQSDAFACLAPKDGRKARSIGEAVEKAGGR